MTYLWVIADWIAAMWSLSLPIALYSRTLWVFTRWGWADRLWRGYARIHQELWLFAPPGLLHSIMLANRERDWVVLFLLLWTVAAWWWFRDWPDDNEWRRRGRKLRDAVKVRAGRLVVVPAAEGAR